MNAMEMSEFLIGLDVGKGAVGIVFPTVENAVVPAGCLAIVTPRQTHTANVAVVTDTAQSYPDTDALVTRRRAHSRLRAHPSPCPRHSRCCRRPCRMERNSRQDYRQRNPRHDSDGCRTTKNTCRHRTMRMWRLLRSERRTCHTLSGRRSGRSRHQK